MPMSLPNDILNGTPVDALPVEQNYNVIEQYVNTNTVLRDGSVAMTGQLTLVGNPMQASHAVPKSYVDTVLPIGVMLDYGGAAAPAGGQWMLCDGATLSTTAYPTLFNVIGFRYGGSGGTFKLPDFGSRVAVAVDSAQARFNTVGKKGGTTKIPMPSHTHTINHDHGTATSGSGLGSHSHDVNQFSAGGGALDALRTKANSTPGTTDRFMRASADGSDSTEQLATDAQDLGHTHSVNLPAFAGSSAATKLEITDPDNATLKSSTDFYAPYLVCNKIIKVK